MQLLHCLLLVIVGVEDTNEPALHVVNGVHANALVLFEKSVFRVQLPQSLFSVPVALRVTNWPGLQMVVVLQVRSEINVAATLSYCSAVQGVVAVHDA